MEEKSFYDKKIIFKITALASEKFKIKQKVLFTITVETVWKKWDWLKNVTLIKKSTILLLPRCYFHNLTTHGVVILTKFHQNWTKIENFLLIPYFLASSHSPDHVCRCPLLSKNWSLNRFCPQYANQFGTT